MLHPHTCALRRRGRRSSACLPSPPQRRRRFNVGRMLGLNSLLIHARGAAGGRGGGHSTSVECMVSRIHLPWGTPRTWWRRRRGSGCQAGSRSTCSDPPAPGRCTAPGCRVRTCTRPPSPPPGTAPGTSPCSPAPPHRHPGPARNRSPRHRRALNSRNEVPRCVS